MKDFIQGLLIITILIAAICLGNWSAQSDYNKCKTDYCRMMVLKGL